MINTEKRDLLKEKTTKIVKHKGKEISVSIRNYHRYRFYDRHRDEDITLYINKGYKSNIYYLVYLDIAIMSDKNIRNLLIKFDNYISKIDGLDNQVKFIKNLTNK